MKKNLIYIVQIFIIYTSLSLATYLMLLTIINYGQFDDRVQFLAFKQDYIDNKIWKTAFYTHVFSAFIALLSGFTQFSSDILVNFKTWHRRLGMIYVGTILLINFPTGMILALFANGGLSARIAFVILDCLWFLFTFLSYKKAIQRNFKSHQEYMIRSYALTLSAITFRIWKIILVTQLSMPPAVFYTLAPWLGFIPNLLIAEWIIHRNKKTQRSKP